MYIQLLVNMLNVRLHSHGGNEEQFTDSRRTVSLRKIEQNVTLPIGELKFSLKLHNSPLSGGACPFREPIVSPLESDKCFHRIARPEQQHEGNQCGEHNKHKTERCYSQVIGSKIEQRKSGCEPKNI